METKFSTIEIFQTPIFEFHSPAGLVEEVLEGEVFKDISNNNYLNTTMHDDETNPNMVNWFRECVDIVADELFIPEVKLEITECWGNYATRYQRHHKHSHQNSIISGCWYLTDHADATINFYQDSAYNFAYPVLDILKPGAKTVKSSISPTVGKLIIFPSNLSHDTTVNLNNDPRLSIAFNTFVSGKFGPSTAHLDINTTRL